MWTGETVLSLSSQLLLAWLLQLYTEKGGARMPASVVPHFARVNSWSTDMRYTPGTIAAHEAKVFLEAAIEIMTWADRRL